MMDEQAERGKVEQPHLDFDSEIEGEDSQDMSMTVQS